MYFERNVRKLRQMLAEDGFTLERGGHVRSHEKWARGSNIVMVPRTKEVEKADTLKNIYRQAGWL